MQDSDIGFVRGRPPLRGAQIRAQRVAGPGPGRRRREGLSGMPVCRGPGPPRRIKGGIIVSSVCLGAGPVGAVSRRSQTPRRLAETGAAWRAEFRRRAEFGGRNSQEPLPAATATDSDAPGPSTGRDGGCRESNQGTPNRSRAEFAGAFAGGRWAFRTSPGHRSLAALVDGRKGRSLHPYARRSAGGRFAHVTPLSSGVTRLYCSR